MKCTSIDYYSRKFKKKNLPLTISKFVTTPRSLICGYTMGFWAARCRSIVHADCCSILLHTDEKLPKSIDKDTQMVEVSLHLAIIMIFTQIILKVCKYKLYFQSNFVDLHTKPLSTICLYYLLQNGAQNISLPKSRLHSSVFIILFLWSSYPWPLQLAISKPSFFSFFFSLLFPAWLDLYYTSLLSKSLKFLANCRCTINKTNNYRHLLDIADISCLVS